MSYKNAQGLQFNLHLDVNELEIVLFPRSAWSIDSLVTCLSSHLSFYKQKHMPLRIFVEKRDKQKIIIKGKLVHAAHSLYNKRLISWEYKLEIVLLVTKDAIQDALEITPEYEHAVLKSKLHQSIESEIFFRVHESLV